MPLIALPGLPVDRIQTPSPEAPQGARLAPLVVAPIASRRATAALTQAAALAAASGKETFVAAGAATQQRPTAAASGRESFTASAAITQVRAIAAASGKEVFTAAAAVTQVRAAASASGRETFVATGSITQQRATAAASGKELFTGIAAITQAAAIAAASGKETFVASAAAAQSVAVGAAAGTNYSINRIGSGAAVQLCAVVAIEATNVPPPALPEPPEPPHRIHIWDWEHKNRASHVGWAATQQRAAQVRARGTVVPAIRGSAAAAQAVAYARAIALQGDSPEEELLILTR